MQRFIQYTLVAFAILLGSNNCFGEQTWMVEVDQDGKKVTGKLMAWDAKKFFLLGLDGQILKFDISLAADSPRFNRPYEPYTHMEMKRQLEEEFGRRYQVTSTRNYMVVHPNGQRKLWGNRFEQLYREMTHYFSTRRISVTQPSSLLVAIVFETQSEFEEYMSKTDVSFSYEVAGFYSGDSNRVAMYDVTGGDEKVDWRYNGETIVHEAAHQTAYNTGIHNRFSAPPKWLSEGIGTIFEAPGIYDASEHRELEDRINQAQLAAFRSNFPDGISEESFAAIVSDDNAFRTNANAGYAFAWAYTFYLAETQPARLSEYLQLTASKPAFTDVGPEERLSDFRRVFGDNLKMTAVRLNRYIEELSVK